MSFITQYYKASHEYFNSKKIGNAIYSVGHIEGTGSDRFGLVTKTNDLGAVIWEKSYEFAEKSVYFNDVVGCDNGDILVLGIYDNQRGCSLTRIDSAGNFLWHKFYPPYVQNDEEGATVPRLIKIGQETYLLQIDAQFYDSYSGIVQPENIFYKVDGDGSLLLSRRIESGLGKISTTDLRFNANKIVFCGNRMYFDQDVKTGGVVILLDLNLQIDKKYLVSEGANAGDHLPLEAAYFSGEDFIVFGFIERGYNYPFLLKFKPDAFGVVYMELMLQSHFRECFFNDNAIYLQDNQRTDTYIARFNHDVQLVWHKIFDPGNTNTKLICQVNQTDIAINNRTFVGLLNLGFESCLTFDKQPFTTDSKGIYLREPELGMIEAPFDSKSYVLERHNIASKRENICPPVGDGGCERDEIICDFYIKVLDIYNGCLVNPENIETPNWQALIQCQHQLLNSIKIFDDAHPQYNLVDNIEPQIQLISAFISNPNMETYVLAWNAVQDILDYLFELGDCDCGGLEIDENTMLQSGHFYIQAAGSIGQDSTKGIHLRWALKGALLKHLPKADYSATTVNFNKPNDYVKIHRAVYEPKPVLLDFNLPPNAFNDTTRVWMYNCDGYLYYVSFKDQARYSVARSMYDPSAEPLDFIKKYGNALIEIENKTQLSFAATPNFIALGGTEFVKLELLSVEENKITAPKGTSHRRKYTLPEINGTTLYGENIRTFRFTPNNALIEKIEFEPYMAFITNSDFGAIGQYALTTDATTAFERLEPQLGCLDPWLRYNDDAFVNPDNYRNRWNGPSVDPADRIESAVQQYITLSELADNPEANEVIPELENFEISNLHLLQLGALDYHIARMLGLGILDLDAEVLQGKHVYIAEYITFGDLQDGLGAREVKHIYCSLPTSIEDQRLPLAVDLKEPVPGVYYSGEIETETIMTDENGYSQDGRSHFLTLYPEPLPEEPLNSPFYYQDVEFSAADNTIPVYIGLEYRNTAEDGAPLFPWVKPELTHDRDYFNIDQTVDPEFTNETRAIVIPEEGFPLYIHREKHNGYHDYSSYGVNWFSRATASTVIWPVLTQLQPFNALLPPTNVTATLIRKENPILLTSPAEQAMYTGLTATDKTLIRLTFEYNHAQELIDYHKMIDGVLVSGFEELPDGQELFAEDIQIFFRNRVPDIVSGQITLVDNDPNAITCDVHTGPGILESQGLDAQGDPITLTPVIAANTAANYIGSVLNVGGFEYLVHQVDTSQTYPVFTIFKREPENAAANTQPTPATALLPPAPGGLFVVVENMLNEGAWGTQNPLPYAIDIEHLDVHREEISVPNQDGTVETHLQKFRGIYDDAVIEKIFENVDDDNDGIPDIDTQTGLPIERHFGLYTVTFPSVTLDQHTQHTNANHPVEWYNGIVRIRTMLGMPDLARKEFKVIRIENIGTLGLVLYIEDLAFPEDPLLLASYDGKLMPDNVSSINQKVNFYPGYKVYLHENAAYNLSESAILPASEDEIKYSIFGLRSHDVPGENLYDNTVDFYSKMSVPALMFAQAIIEPLPPKVPVGGDYATRPDFFGKATYTFTNDYDHKPHSVQLNRATDIQILSAIFNNVIEYDPITGEPTNLPTTVQTIVSDIFMNGTEDFYVNRWNNLLGFDYLNGEFEKFPDDQGVALPMPDSEMFIDSVNDFIDRHNEYYQNLPSTVPHITTPITDLNVEVIPEVTVGGVVRNGQLILRDFIKDIIFNCFVPLTEIPVIYDYIKGGDYEPIPKKQHVRDRNGNLLSPDHPDFDMAPMMKKIGVNKTSFTDFGLDGASNAKYFYTAREINMQMKTSDYSPIKGPISLVNSAPPTAPEVVKVTAQLEDREAGTPARIDILINSFKEIEHISKINVYRADNPTDSLSIRTMKLVKVIDTSEFDPLAKYWAVSDSFEDLTETPYGDPLYYKMTVSRAIKYNDKDGNPVEDLAPSEASKLVITNVSERYNPVSPVLQYASEPISGAGLLEYVTFFWDTTTYKGKYHVYQMSAQGNWIKIAEVTSNNSRIYLPLEETALASSALETQIAGSQFFHRFKVMAENTAGMFSREDNVLTVYTPDTWQDTGGIGEMVIEGTFIVRP